MAKAFGSEQEVRVNVQGPATGSIPTRTPTGGGLSRALSGLGDAASKLFENQKDLEFGADIARAQTGINNTDNAAETTLLRRAFTTELVKKYGASKINLITQGLASTGAVTTTTDQFGNVINFDASGNIIGGSTVQSDLEDTTIKNIAESEANYPQTSEVVNSMVGIATKSGEALDAGEVDTIIRDFARTGDEAEDIVENFFIASRSGTFTSAEAIATATATAQTRLRNLVWGKLDTLDSPMWRRLLASPTNPLGSEQGGAMIRAFINDTMNQLSSAEVGGVDAFTALKLDRGEFEGQLNTQGDILVQSYEASLNASSVVQARAVAAGQALIELERQEVLLGLPDNIRRAALTVEQMLPVVQMTQIANTLTVQGSLASPAQKAFLTDIFKVLDGYAQASLTSKVVFNQEIKDTNSAAGFLSFIRNKLEPTNPLDDSTWAVTNIDAIIAEVTKNEEVLKQWLPEKSVDQFKAELLKRQKKINSESTVDERADADSWFNTIGKFLFSSDVQPRIRPRSGEPESGITIQDVF